MMNPQWLRSFVVLAERGSFTRTADQLGLTQAAVSQHIHHLEAQLGPLLIRRPRQVELTPAGQALLGYCDDMEQAEKRLNLRLSGADDRQGEISLITPGSIGLSLYPLLLDLQASYPGLSVRIRMCWRVCATITLSWGWLLSSRMTRAWWRATLPMSRWTWWCPPRPQLTAGKTLKALALLIIRMGTPWHRVC